MAARGVAPVIIRDSGDVTNQRADHARRRGKGPSEIRLLHHR